jgi:hypothetical protein
VACKNDKLHNSNNNNNNNNNNNIDKIESNASLKAGEFLPEAVGFMLATQDQAVSNSNDKNYKNCIFKYAKNAERNEKPFSI